MRNIDVKEIENTVRDLCIKANIFLPESLECTRIKKCGNIEKSPVGKEVFLPIYAIT